MSLDPPRRKGRGKAHQPRTKSALGAERAGAVVDGAPVPPDPCVVALVPSTTSWRGRLRALWPLLVVVVLAELLGLLGVSVLHLSEGALLVGSFGVGIVWLLGLRAYDRRPAPPLYRLAISADSATLVDRAARVLVSCPLRDLQVELRSYVVRTRFGSHEYPTLWLRWPNRRSVTLGPNEYRVASGKRRRVWRGPSLLVSGAEWDALSEQLERATQVLKPV